MQQYINTAAACSRLSRLNQAAKLLMLYIKKQQQQQQQNTQEKRRSSLKVLNKGTLSQFPELQLSCFVILRFITLHGHIKHGKVSVKQMIIIRRPTTGPLFQYNNILGA